MIFVTLGTQKFQLNRLLEQIDKLCKKGIIEEEVYAQIGYSDYIPKNYEFIDFLNKEEFNNKMRESTMVITHSGVGSIITAINMDKPTIVFPRLRKYKEHVDDHQLEIAEAFMKKNFVLYCTSSDELEMLIEKARTYKFDKYISSTENILNIISTAIQ